MTPTTSAAASPPHHHGYKWAKGMRGRQAWRGHTSTHTFFLFSFYLLTQLQHKWRGGTPSSLSITHSQIACTRHNEGRSSSPLSAFSCTRPNKGKTISPLAPFSCACHDSQREEVILHFLVPDTTRGGRPPLLAHFVALITTREGHLPLLPCFLAFDTQGEVILPLPNYHLY